MRTAWAFELKGDPCDLADLAYFSSTNAVRVKKRGEVYELVMPSHTVDSEYSNIKRSAETLVDWLNGLGKLYSDTFEGVVLVGPLFSLDEAGERRDTVIFPETGRFRLRGMRATILVNGKEAPDPEKDAAARALKSASEKTAIGDALTLVGRPNPTWSELYVIYELVESASKGQQVKAGWVSKAELDSFKRTANSYTALGVSGRHGAATHPAPAKPMPYEEAIEVVRRMVKGWLASQT